MSRTTVALDLAQFHGSDLLPLPPILVLGTTYEKSSSQELLHVIPVYLYVIFT